MNGRTTLIITHRTDRIVVFAEGPVLEQGRGPELVERGGVFARLYRSANLTWAERLQRVWFIEDAGCDDLRVAIRA